MPKVTLPPIASDASQDVETQSALSTLNIVIPSGEPLCKPKGYVGGKPVWLTEAPWAKPIEDEDISKWALKIYDLASKENMKFHPLAIKYWARYFWAIGTDEHQRACRVIDETFQVPNAEQETAE